MVKMLVQQLIELLKKEEEILDSLFDTATLKQSALVSNNREALDECTHREEGLLPQFQSYERQRRLTMDKVKMENGISDNSKKLEVLVSNLSEIFDESVIEPIKVIHVRIKEKVINITKMNKQNLFLINQSRKFINDTINTLVSKNEKSILDRKV